VGNVPRRPATDSTRERILSEALCRFSLQGFAATSTREIADALGLTKAALYYHFATKDDILAALVSTALDQLRQILDGARGHTSPQARRQLLAAYIDYTATHADLIRVFALDPSARARPALLDTAALGEALVRTLSGVDEPDVGQRTRVRAAVGGIHAAIRGHDLTEDREVVRRAALAAACGALGIAPPRGDGRGGGTLIPPYAGAPDPVLARVADASCRAEVTAPAG
jgi:AcrR family transcriptional regulator